MSHLAPPVCSLTYLSTSLEQTEDPVLPLLAARRKQASLRLDFVDGMTSVLGLC